MEYGIVGSVGWQNNSQMPRRSKQRVCIVHEPWNREAVFVSCARPDFVGCQCSVCEERWIADYKLRRLRWCEFAEIGVFNLEALCPWRHFEIKGGCRYSTFVDIQSDDRGFRKKLCGDKREQAGARANVNYGFCRSICRARGF